MQFAGGQGAGVPAPTRVRRHHHLRAGWIGSFLAATLIGLMLESGLKAYVLHIFALGSLVAATAPICVEIETKGQVLENISEDEMGGTA
jgi:hypothetical protein